MIAAGIILINKQNKTLLLLRDDRIEIPYANMWDIPGGKVEIGETPELAIRREMNEELGIKDLGEINLFKIISSEKITDYIFWKRLNINTNELVLNEGQKIEYFDLDTIKKTELAFKYNFVLEEFYNQILKIK